VDRAAEDAAGTFGKRVAALEADVVVDMICFTPDSAAALVEAVRDMPAPDPLRDHLAIWAKRKAADA
jgi:hypothetical protein